MMTLEQRKAVAPGSRKIRFDGADLIAHVDGGVAFLAVRAVVEAMALDWSAQLKRIKAHPVLREGLVILAMPTPGGPQETTCLSLDLVPGWLFTIDRARLRKPERRERVMRFQRDLVSAVCSAVYGDAEAVPVPRQEWEGRGLDCRGPRRGAN